MADLNQQTVTSPVQPGTSNLPYPAGGLPAWNLGVPVVFNVTTDSAAVITELATTITELGEVRELILIDYLSKINNTLLHISAGLNEYSDNLQAIQKKLPDLEKSVLSVIGPKSTNSALMATMIASTIQTNQIAVSVRDEQPVMPSVQDQMTESIKESVKLSVITTAQAEASITASSWASGVATWISESGPYKTVAGWIDDVTQTLTTYYESAKTTLMKLFAKSGTPPG